MGGFGDDPSASHLLCSRFLGLLHQLHLTSSGVGSQRWETPALILPMMDNDALSHPRSLENLLSTKLLPDAERVGGRWDAEQNDLFMVRGSSRVVRLRILTSVHITVTMKHPFFYHYFITKGTVILQHANCWRMRFDSYHVLAWLLLSTPFLNRETEAQQDLINSSQMTWTESGKVGNQSLDRTIT